ncbi:uncharacterized protein PV09_02367 [Verruconis gallopava]|uniref:RWD domain-containing protein n=1 Tax=Verruconis gallopava TaxID=253628 RepID=A0A0D1XV47_9PEZI|nr:uncharacterized protein PV09_02367 [Verruconis gallopava]KIW06661.1 hypothetical protein PV09_02367 [Verruconis gallopava]
MGLDEQKEEREVLESIFPDEITDISETEFRVSIQLDVASEYGENIEGPTLLLKVEYPPDYPDEAPRLDILAPPNAPKHQYFDVQEDKAKLLSSLEPTIEENMGMAMVFTLVSSLKDAAELLISERQKAARTLKEAEAAKAEEEENRKFHGTPVTRETFLAWRAKFKQEMAEEERRRREELEAEELKKRKGVKEEVRLTGRQLWERGLAGKAGEEDEEGEADALAAAVATNVKIGA